MFLEDQACNGLRLWAENFDDLTVMMPVTDAEPPPSWGPLDNVGPNLDRITVVPLPMAYRPDQFLRHQSAVRSEICRHIRQADYVSFAIGGLFGDWGSVGCHEAYKMGRPYGIWTDRVESKVVRQSIGQGHWRQSLRARLYHRPMAWLERRLIRRAHVGFFHGRETYETYAPFCRNPQLVHDIHIRKEDHIQANDLEQKASHAGQPLLKIVYMGRADPMKGPFDWVNVLKGAADAGAQFQASWIGEGSELESMRRKVAELGLTDRISTPGFMSDRKLVLSALRDADIFLFCHKTPESPRCLIEALTCGTPIVGYDGAFARDLISPNGGGALVPLNDVTALTDKIVEISQYTDQLSELIRRAAADGAPYDDVSVFRHRSELIREQLPPA
ncbi:MAG: glycosyltransferase [Rhodobacterales bacterium]